jgi:hypothetical protein
LPGDSPEMALRAGNPASLPREPWVWPGV